MNNKVLKQKEFELEKDLQKFVEEHISDILGNDYEFVSTEFSVGNFRIDTLAFNKDSKSFVIIEDKNVRSKSVVDQGLTYLKLLRERTADFILKYNEVKKTNLNLNDIDISQSRVIFFSPFFTEYQMYSADYQNTPFELYKIKKYEDGVVDIEKVEKTSKEKFNNELISSNPVDNNENKIVVYTEDDHFINKPEKIKELYEKLKDKILELGDIDIDVKKVYIAFKGSRNIVDIEVFKSHLQVYINMKYGTINDKYSMLKTFVLDDGKSLGHHGNGDYYFNINSENDIDNLIPLIKQSYEVNKK
jgi:predicted transport protein